MIFRTQFTQASRSNGRCNCFLHVFFCVYALPPQDKNYIYPHNPGVSLSLFLSLSLLQAQLHKAKDMR